MIDLTIKLVMAIFIVILSIGLLIYIIITEKNKKERKKWCLISIVFMIIGIILSCNLIRKIIDFKYPAQTIIQNGHTYHLADDVPDEEIEVNGHKYILADE